MTKPRHLLALAAAGLLVFTGEAVAKDQIHQTLDVPAQFAATIQTADCTAMPGPRVTLSGNLTLSPVDIDVIFSHVMHQPDPQSSVNVLKAVVPANTPPTAAPEQSVVGAMANNPFLWLQLYDSKGRPLTSEVFLGRCDQGTFTPTINLALPSESTASVSADSCDAATGPKVSLDGQFTTSPIVGKVIFRNSDQLGVGGPKPAEVSLNVLIVAAGPTFQLPESAVAGTGGNPIISTQYRLSDGTAIGIEQNLGRCSAIVVK
jgi:hypothetical protein